MLLATHTCWGFTLCASHHFLHLCPRFWSFSEGPACSHCPAACNMMYTPQPAASSTELAWCTARRYDSAGVCIDGQAKRLVIAKATGKVDVLAELANARVNDDITCPGDEVLLNDIRLPPPNAQNSGAGTIRRSMHGSAIAIQRLETACLHHAPTAAAAAAAAAC